MVAQKVDQRGHYIFFEPDADRLSNKHNSSLGTSRTTRYSCRLLRKIIAESAVVLADSRCKKQLCDETETVVLMKRKTKYSEGQARLPPLKQISTTAIKLKPLFNVLLIVHHSISV
jgi:hypothetical protein